MTFSPRAWGWSAMGLRQPIRDMRSPHVRGDGPDFMRATPIGCGSPHVRGDGPHMLIADEDVGTVLPTCVGMVL